MSFNFEDPGKDGPIDIHVLRDARAKVAKRGGELVYTVINGFYQYREFGAPFWQDCSDQLRLALIAMARQDQITSLNEFSIKYNR